jgi:hypothetical protein
MFLSLIQTVKVITPFFTFFSSESLICRLCRKKPYVQASKLEAKCDVRTLRKQKKERVEMGWQKHLPTAGEQFPTNTIQTTREGGGGMWVNGLKGV